MENSPENIRGYTDIFFTVCSDRRPHAVSNTTTNITQRLHHSSHLTSLNTVRSFQTENLIRTKRGPCRVELS